MSAGLRVMNENIFLKGNSLSTSSGRSGKKKKTKHTTREGGSEAIPSFFSRDNKILREQDDCAVRIKIQKETK